MARNDIDKPYGINYTEEVHRRLEKVAALLDLEDTKMVWSRALSSYEEYAKQRVRGLKPVLVSPELANLISQNPHFFEALTEPGLVEWLEPLVKSKPLDRQAQ
jgi:hypothetical protein